MSGSLVWVFADGVGLGAEDGSNPWTTSPAPFLSELLGGPLTRERVGAADGRLLTALDATLGVPGLPQSATGQTALFTGLNAPRHVGRHVTALPGPRLRELIEAHSVLATAVRRGARVTFANPYTASYLEELGAGRRRSSVTTACCFAAGLELRRLDDLLRDEAVAWDVCRDAFASRAGVEVEPIRPREAGRHLAGLATGHDLVLFETFYSDLAGHGREGFEPGEAVRRLDGLLLGLAETLPAETTWILTSDHGNLEDTSVRTHTRNPVPLLVCGPAAEPFSNCRDLTDVAPAILTALNERPAGLGRGAGSSRAPRRGRR